jgi:hypothetical protein
LVALGDSYATAAEYRTQTGKTGTASDALVLSQLKAVSRYLDRALVRPLGFNKDGTAAVRVYVMGRGHILDIDDHVSVSSVEIGDKWSGDYQTALATTAYALLPRNAALGPESRPYRQIEFLTTNPGFDSLVRVTGIGGWNAVPDAIKIATIELAAIFRIESARATSSINEMQQLVSTSKEAKGILAGITSAYRQHTRAYL